MQWVEQKLLNIHAKTYALTNSSFIFLFNLINQDPPNPDKFIIPLPLPLFHFESIWRHVSLSPFLLTVRIRIFLEQNQYHASNIQCTSHPLFRTIRSKNARVAETTRNDASFSRNWKIQNRREEKYPRCFESSYVFTGVWTARVSSPLMKISKLAAHRESVISRGR